MFMFFFVLANQQLPVLMYGGPSVYFREASVSMFTPQQKKKLNYCTAVAFKRDVNVLVPQK